MSNDKPMALGAELDFKFNWSPWLEKEVDTIAAYSVAVSPGLEVISHSRNGGVVTAYVRLLRTVRVGTVLRVVCSITTASNPPRKDSRSSTVRAEIR